MPEHAKKENKQDQVEDKISTFVVIFICLLFLGYIGFQTFSIRKDTKGAPSGLRINPQPAVGIPTKYNCPQHDNDFDACVKAQVSGKGCSWYASCNKCIVGSHDGKTYEEICGNKR